MWFEGWWSDCCRIHDLAYAEQVQKALADADLAACVALAADSPGTAVLGAVVAGSMFVGVKLFGGRFYRKAKEPKD